jgi:hypothetical protein
MSDSDDELNTAFIDEENITVGDLETPDELTNGTGETKETSATGGRRRRSMRRRSMRRRSKRGGKRRSRRHRRYKK